MKNQIKIFSMAISILLFLSVMAFGAPASAQEGPALPTLYMTVKPDSRIEPGSDITILLWTDPVKTLAGETAQLTLWKQLPEEEVSGFPPPGWEGLFGFATKEVTLGAEGQHAEIIDGGLPRGVYLFSSAVSTTASPEEASITIFKIVHVGAPLLQVDLYLYPDSGYESLSDWNRYVLGDIVAYSVLADQSAPDFQNFGGNIVVEVTNDAGTQTYYTKTHPIVPGNTEVFDSFSTDGWDELPGGYVFTAEVQADDGRTATGEQEFYLANVVLTGLFVSWPNLEVRGEVFEAWAATFTADEVTFDINDGVAGTQVDSQTIPVTGWEASLLFDSSTFQVSAGGYIEVDATARVTLNPEYTDSATYQFPDFIVDVEPSNFGIIDPGDELQIHVWTRHAQPDRAGSLTIAKEGEAPIVDVSLALDSVGETTVVIPGTETTTWQGCSYMIDVTIDGELSTQIGSAFLSVGTGPMLESTSSKPAYEGYDPLVLTLDLTPSKTNTVLSLFGSDDLFFGTSYAATYSGVDFSSVVVHVPITSHADATWGFSVTVGSDGCSGWDFGSVGYIVGSVDTDGDWLPDPAEDSLSYDGRKPSVDLYDTDGDQQYDGIEVYYGFDPTDPGSMIPEFSTILVFAAVPAVFLILLLYKKRLPP